MFVYARLPKTLGHLSSRFGVKFLVHPSLPHGGIMLNYEKKIPVACNLCSEEPKCIEFCPEEALELVSKNTVSQKTWISSLAKPLIF